ncbi:hypothetical protein KIN20_019158 [Parelaphostrongylus tenuis]|uniref:Uncharacterized protein n=1 Tax=Parelaphostrongylus tenuis TaxID=148309 RepID=A0AAD5MP50_PARTN|nr:hypothetical protein KIN20_019158 [Parelaphostrongylus tenuis]
MMPVSDYNGQSFDGVDHVFRERSSQINVNSTTSAGSCRPIAAGDSFNTSSEEVFAAMECEMRQWLSSIDESGDNPACNLQDTFSNILSGM